MTSWLIDCSRVLQDTEKPGGGGKLNEKLLKAGEFWVKSGKRENEGKLGDLATLTSGRSEVEWKMCQKKIYAIISSSPLDHSI